MRGEASFVSASAKTIRRAVLITGGTGVLGSAVTKRFLEDGHNVVATSRTRASPEAVNEGLARFRERLDVVPADVTDERSVGELVDRAVASLGTVEVLIHLVGGWSGGRPLQDVSVESWEHTLELNLRSAFLCSRAVLPIMRRQGWGRLVFVSSKAARSDRRHQGAYAIAKAAVSVLAEVIAEENGDLDVTANVVAPSALDTSANRAAPASDRHSSLVSLDDVSRMIAFLASDEAGQLRGAWLPAFGQA